MADKNRSGDLAAQLKPFHERARLAEERLERLEAALQARQGSPSSVDSKVLDSLLELRRKLEASRTEQLAERAKAAKDIAALTVEKEKLQYQVLHLKRSLEESDKKLLKVMANE